MFWKSIFIEVVLIAYLLITGAAFLFTMTRIKVPVLPWPMVYQSFMLIAPYQGDVSWNGDWVAEGLGTDDLWHPIPLDPYFPAIRGEASVRMALRSFYLMEDSDLLYQKYRELALLLKEREYAKGNVFTKVRLWYRTWPRTPEGYSALYRETFFLKNELVTLVP